MAVQRNKVARPVPSLGRSREGFFTIRPLGGINNQMPVHSGNLQEALLLENIQVEDIGYRVRSGLSSLYTLNTSSITTAGVTTSNTSRIEYMRQAKEYLVAVAGQDLYFTSTAADPGTVMSQASSGISMPALSYSISTQRYDSGLVDDPTYGQSLVITAVDKMVPQILPLNGTSSHTTHGGFVDSGNSFAYTAAGIDDRLVFFGTVSSTGTEYKTRVQWTARGSSDSFIPGGFEDLVDMSGTARVLIPQGDRALMFTEREFWQATVRRDQYAFDFKSLRKDLGIISTRAFVDTPFGLFWVANDKTVRRLFGNRISTVSRKIDNYFKSPAYTSAVPLLIDADTDTYLTVGATGDDKYIAFSGGYLTIDTSGSQAIVTNDYLGSGSAVGFIANLFLTYNPDEKEVIVWWGNDASAGNAGASRAFSIRADTITPISDTEDDAVWTYFTTPENINTGTSFTDANGSIHMLYGSASDTSWPEIYLWDSSRTNDSMMGQDFNITGKWWTNTLLDKSSRNLKVNNITLWTEEMGGDAGVRRIDVSHGTSPKVSANMGPASRRTFSFGEGSSADSSYQPYNFNDKAGPWNWFLVEMKPEAAQGKMVITEAEISYTRYSGRRKGDRIKW